MGYVECSDADNNGNLDKEATPCILVKGTSSPRADEQKEPPVSQIPDGEEEANEAPLVSVDNFLRGQCSPTAKKRKQTKYSRKSRKGKKRARGYEGDEIFQTREVICATKEDGDAVLCALDGRNFNSSHVDSSDENGPQSFAVSFRAHP